MNILHKVLNEQKRLTRQTGKRLTTVYLGEAEWQELNDIERGVEFRDKFYCKQTKKYGGYFCAGLKIVRVLEISHLQII